MLTVQQSFPPPRPTTNPYIVMLHRALDSTPGVAVRTFSWRGAVLGDYDVFHAHWPENLVTGRSALKKLVRQGLFVLLMLKLRICGIPIVRTQHNLDLPTGITAVERALLRWFDRWTTLKIALNETTEFAPGVQSVLIPHGHYRDWFASYERSEPLPDSFGYVGLIRRYKNVDALTRAFLSLQGAFSLRIAGKPSSAELARPLIDAAGSDSRIRLQLEFLSDRDLVEVVTASELIVLPYAQMHNSGGVLAALSLDRPVLAPKNATNALLAQEVGEGWLLQYDGDLTSEHLVEALDRARDARRTPRPDLDGRGWDRAGERHLEAYRSVAGAAPKGRRTDQITRVAT